MIAGINDEKKRGTSWLETLATSFIGLEASNNKHSTVVREFNFLTFFFVRL